MHFFTINDLFPLDIIEMRNKKHENTLRRNLIIFKLNRRRSPDFDLTFYDNVEQLASVAEPKDYLTLLVLLNFEEGVKVVNSLNFSCSFGFSGKKGIVFEKLHQNVDVGL